jgi:hypothetical protein
MCKVHIYIEPMTSNATALPIDALLAAFRSVLRPLARLAVASGLTYPRIDEVLREVLVDAASAAHSSLPPQRRVSRISTTLGLHRREVTRLSRREAEAPAAPPSHTTRLFLKWQSDPRFRDASGSLQSLPRVGDDLSFEKLAQQVTRDVHPRSLLGELCRLGLARHDEERDTVTLMVDAFVPRGDKARMLGFLGANVGDHFDAAVTNVLSDGREHFEQAIFADELSVESVRAFRETITRQWQALRAAAVPALETLIEVDRATGRTQDQRLRIGLFSWAGAMRAGTANAADAAPASEAPAGGPPAGDARVPPDTAGLPPAGTPSASSGAEAQPRGRGTSSAAVRRGKRAGKDGRPVDSTGKSKRRDSSQ